MKPVVPISASTPSVACMVTTRTMQIPFATSTQAIRAASLGAARPSGVRVALRGAGRP